MIELKGTITSVSRDTAGNRTVTIALDLQPGAVAKSTVDVISSDLQLDQRVEINIDNA